MPESKGYAFNTDDVDNEAGRLDRQSDYLGDATREWLNKTGITVGSSVIEVGCGMGGVTLVLSEMVGPSGRVVAVDRDLNMVTALSARVKELGASNVTVTQSDFADLDVPDGAFDGAVGRLVLMYQPDPVGSIRALATKVRSGGVVGFFESSHAPEGHRAPGYEWNQQPSTPLVRAVYSWIVRATMSTGVVPYLGLRLPATLADAGLTPSMDITVFTGISPASELAHMASLVRALLPTLEAQGIATAEEVDIETLEDRLRADCAPYALFEPYPMIGAYATKP